MKLTNGQLAKAKTAKSAEELLALAKAEGIALSKEEATKYFADLHKEGELSDDELDNVSGGGCGDPPESRFKVGDWIGGYFLLGQHYKVLSVTWTGSDYSYCCFLVTEGYDGTTYISPNRDTLYESNMTGYVKEDYAHADLYVDVT